ncbi:Uncharacterised protein [Vibrio cholerae]|nr:Uncharacterised protein [Vibrio cholerae]
MFPSLLLAISPNLRASQNADSRKLRWIYSL